MKLQSATVLITGANRGIGLAFARAALLRGARKVYAGARDPTSETLPGVDVVQLDVTRPEDIAAAEQRCGDLTLLINNAGVAILGGFLFGRQRRRCTCPARDQLFRSPATDQGIRSHAGGEWGCAILNVLSIATWVSSPRLATQSASKSAAWGAYQRTSP
ncbi:SDR family NAD(P)-dependent oxidoreductase [Variovorax sp. E3]|uniref:SDR family NAD(P)-dependent oxidoreductase n=1 Tax=Variovorax sp. E3 TaxID=1914993 RepID=UPI0018DD9471|nr:SDR family NAD(P)-dependent oxidoreductase [Variovorax sp. E3]